MITAGQLLLLATFVAACCGAIASAAGWRLGHRGLVRVGAAAIVAVLVGLTALAAILGYALLTCDFRFAYVADYSNRSLPWYYALSALWVGQSGSLLVWTWLLAAVTAAFRFLPVVAGLPTEPHRSDRRSPQASPNAADLRQPAFAMLMLCLSFLVSLLVFGADPMEPSLSTPRDGAGMAPSLQHPAMLAHPPIVFFSYALWTVPFALGLAALATRRLDDTWVRAARGWALAAWSVLGVGILLGAYWAYEELGWGGYWAWDPVENASLLPWLTGTALIHSALAWRARGVLKRATLLLAVATFGLCNYAAFLTRSGAFGSVHEFSRSPLGWMFLAMMLGLCAAALALMFFRRRDLQHQSPITNHQSLVHDASAPPRRFGGVLSRESAVAVAAVALTAMAAVVLVGTSLIPLSDLLLGRRITVGPSFYNGALAPVTVVLLATTAAAPLLRWGAGPARRQRAALAASIGVALAAVLGAAVLFGIRRPMALCVAGLAAFAVAVLAGMFLLDLRRNAAGRPAWPRRVVRTLLANRRRYAAFTLHMALVCLAVGVAGSSLGTQSEDILLRRGEPHDWAGGTITLAEIEVRQLPDRRVVQTRLEIVDGASRRFVLRPSQQFHIAQREWAGEVAIHSTWAGDVYTILHGGVGMDKASVTVIVNPMVRWIWISGLLVAAAAPVCAWPARGNARGMRHGRETVPQQPLETMPQQRESEPQQNDKTRPRRSKAA